ncbi:TadE/TadG family type IV pilus assembly protein [Pseudidiomarina woesei]|uniref:TadE-like protein n=1 Tax=Pseudidiomarina woesei TaxID=1381080 RepID=A0A0K6GY53_9GAMM|nr:TadE family protein [Pseudidiomarina woesei]CUA83549.1 TadE-like protein [Pseudidiomarina woesei]
MRKHEFGASTVEAMLLLPLIIWLALAGLQLLWIFWAQQTLHNTGHYVLRAGQVGHAQELLMVNTLATGMAATEPQWYTDPVGEDNSQQRESALRATAKALIHARTAAKITVHSPTHAQQEQYMEHRFSLREQQWLDEIAVDHARARTSNFSAEVTQQWLAARQLDIEVWWCLPLQVPMVAPVLQSWWQLVNNPAQRYCRARELLIGKPLWPLVTRRKGPMLSGYRAN